MMCCMMDHDMNHTESEQVQTHPESAIDILKKRYVSGEIGKEEFEEKKKDLA